MELSTFKNTFSPIFNVIQNLQYLKIIRIKRTASCVNSLAIRHIANKYTERSLLLHFLSCMRDVCKGNE